MSEFDPDDFDHDYLDTDVPGLRRSINNRLVYTIGKDPYTANEKDWLKALSYAVRERLIERWMETQRRYYRNDAKRVYYLSLEFLIGRSLNNALLNIGFRDNCVEALKGLGLDLEVLQELEHDAALGNGGLGRLAACILDSIATLNLPGVGYGIRYEYGMFRQKIEGGQQMELPENWLSEGNPWEFARPEVIYKVRFGGRAVEYQGSHGRRHFHWIEGDEIMAMAYDTPIPGYHTDTVNNLRLWSAKASHEFDLEKFNRGDYIRAVEDKTLSENLSKVLYPDDRASENQELRLRQQYFFVSASLQDILRRYLNDHDDFSELPDRVAIQLNDTHPSIAIPELMRLLLDEYHLEWQPAWDITVRTFSYTNHTLLPEALETWPINLLNQLLPRHMQLIYEINRRMLLNASHLRPNDSGMLQRISIIDEHNGRRVRMAHLAIAGSHTVNGVSALHSNLLQSSTFADFHQLYPGRFINITNGITPRRWLMESNPPLSGLICSAIGSDWVRDLEQLAGLIPLADDSEFQRRFAAAKMANKQRLTDLIKFHLDTEVDPHTLFDVQVKRIHEYKRQLLNVFRVIALYLRLCEEPSCTMAPRTIMIGGKAAPGYAIAKLIIRLVNDVAAIVDNDPAVAGRLKLLFIPNYDVSTATDIIPAAELSQQISTAGMEASGTGNMKLALNGALTMGTLDGANIEIREAVGTEHFFRFGMTEEEIGLKRQQGYDPRRIYEEHPLLKRIIDMISGGYFSPEEPTRYRPLMDHLFYTGDPFMLLADFDSYMDSDAAADRRYHDQSAWNRSAILNVAKLGYFSCDRTVREYAEKVWKVSPVEPRRSTRSTASPSP